MQQRSVVVLGSTGSVGTQAVGLIAENPERFTVAGIAAGGRQPGVIAEQVVTLHPRTVAIAETAQLAEVTDAVAAACRTAGIAVPTIVAGASAVTELAGAGADVVLNGITGAVGLESTLAALHAGSTLALANKESLVVGGALVAAAQQRPDQIVPVDSEHAAIAQCLRSGTHAEVSRLVLTASGGPFRGWTPAQLAEVDVANALAHPTWSMGPVITVNSATLVNKALEVIEAHLLFAVPIERVAVVVHPQSVVHSMVEFVDGSTIAQLSPASMLIPIAWGLSWPERLPGAAPACDWSTAATWTFEPLDEQTFPAVQLARDAVATSATHPAVLNAANEVCVDAFLGGRLRFDRIVPTVARVVAEHTSPEGELTVASLEAVQQAARRDAARYVAAADAGR